MENRRSEVQGQPELYSKFKAGVAATREPISKSNTTLGGLNVEWCGFYIYNIASFDRERARRGPSSGDQKMKATEEIKGKPLQDTGGQGLSERILTVWVITLGTEKWDYVKS